MVKADAYGLGAARVIPALYEAGCRLLRRDAGGGRSSAERSRPAPPSTCSTASFPDAADALLRLGVSPVMASLDDVEPGRRCRARGPRPPAALHVDTGLNRSGMSEAMFASLAADADLMAGSTSLLIMSHLACADDPRDPMNREQLVAFEPLRRSFPKARASLAASDGLMLGKASTSISCGPATRSTADRPRSGARR